MASLLLSWVALLAPASAAADTTLANASASDLTVSGDALFWSRKEGRNRYRLMMLRDQQLTQLPIRPDRFPFFAYAGTDAAGAPVLLYSRCQRGKCRSLYSFALDQGRERRLPVRSRRGCELTAPSIDRGVLAFARFGRCASRGVWLRSANGG